MSYDLVSVWLTVTARQIESTAHSDTDTSHTHTQSQWLTHQWLIMINLYSVQLFS